MKGQYIKEGIKNSFRVIKINIKKLYTALYKKSVNTYKYNFGPYEMPIDDELRLGIKFVENGYLVDNAYNQNMSYVEAYNYINTAKLVHSKIYIPGATLSKRAGRGYILSEDILNSKYYFLFGRPPSVGTGATRDGVRVIRKRYRFFEIFLYNGCIRYEPSGVVSPRNIKRFPGRISYLILQYFICRPLLYEGFIIHGFSTGWEEQRLRYTFGITAADIEQTVDPSDHEEHKLDVMKLMDNAQEINVRLLLRTDPVYWVIPYLMALHRLDMYNYYRTPVRARRRDLIDPRNRIGIAYKRDIDGNGQGGLSIKRNRENTGIFLGSIYYICVVFIKIIINLGFYTIFVLLVPIVLLYKFITYVLPKNIYLFVTHVILDWFILDVLHNYVGKFRNLIGLFVAIIYILLRIGLVLYLRSTNFINRVVNSINKGILGHHYRLANIFIGRPVKRKIYLEDEKRDHILRYNYFGDEGSYMSEDKKDLGAEDFIHWHNTSGLRYILLIIQYIRYEQGYTFVRGLYNKIYIKFFYRSFGFIFNILIGLYFLIVFVVLIVGFIYILAFVFDSFAIYREILANYVIDFLDGIEPIEYIFGIVDMTYEFPEMLAQGTEYEAFFNYRFAGREAMVVVYCCAVGLFYIMFPRISEEILGWYENPRFPPIGRQLSGRGISPFTGTLVYLFLFRLRSERYNEFQQRLSPAFFGFKLYTDRYEETALPDLGELVMEHYEYDGDQFMEVEWYRQEVHLCVSFRIPGNYFGYLGYSTYPRETRRGLMGGHYNEDGGGPPGWGAVLQRRNKRFQRRMRQFEREASPNDRIGANQSEIVDLVMRVLTEEAKRKEVEQSKKGSAIVKRVIRENQTKVKEFFINKTRRTRVRDYIEIEGIRQDTDYY